MPVSADRVIHVQASRRQVVSALRRVPRLVSGRTGAGGAVQALQVRVGLTVLGLIKEAFLVKAQGGTDAAGERWRPLAPSTIAYNRRHPLLTKKKSWLPVKVVRSGFAPSFALTDKQRERWWELYRRGLARYKGDQSHAAAVAWHVVKKEGARTLLEMYGDAKVEILRDTGLLFNSLTPGADPDTAPRSPPRVKHQVFRPGSGEVIVGTNRKWAWTHHKGVPGRLPQRRLWPDPGKWPAFWWDMILEQARLGLIDIIEFLLTR